MDIKHPNWYRVLIGSDIQYTEHENKLLTSFSRYHEMNASSSRNLDNLIAAFNHFKKYNLCSADLNIETMEISPNMEKTIVKHKLIIRNAWEIGEGDLDGAVIRKNDSPIIPIGKDNAPIKNLLVWLNNSNKL